MPKSCGPSTEFFCLFSLTPKFDPKKVADFFSELFSIGEILYDLIFDIFGANLDFAITI